MTNVLLNHLRDHLFRSATFTKPTTLYFALFTTAPTAAGGGVEVSGSGYARVAAPVNDGFFSGDTVGEAENLAVITFPAPTGDWGSVVALGIMSAAVDGEMYLYDDELLGKVISDGDDAPSFPIGNFNFSIT